MAQLNNLIVTGAARFLNTIKGTVEKSNQLASARTIQTNLGSTSAVSFDGTANVIPGITGTLPVGNGGTGQTSAINAANAFMNALGTGSSTPVDADYYISQYVSGGTTTTTYHRRPMSALWEYVKGKISSVLGLTATSYGGSAAQVNGHTVAKDVPANAVFTDTTYDLATPSTAGLLSASDKNKLDSIIVSNANSPVLAVETSSFSSLPVTITSDKITVNHYLLESTLSNPSAQTGDWTVTTANGSMTIAGNISGSTTALIMLGRVDSESATMLVFDIASFSSLPQTVTDSRITPYHYILHTEVGTPTAQTGDWTITTGTGTMTIDGDISGSTTLRVILGTAGSL